MSIQSSDSILYLLLLNNDFLMDKSWDHTNPSFIVENENGQYFYILAPSIEADQIRTKNGVISLQKLLLQRENNGNSSI